ncbi:MAG: hypothetical protein ACLR23_25250 [Clostridia bacterium]
MQKRRSEARTGTKAGENERRRWRQRERPAYEKEETRSEQETRRGKMNARRRKIEGKTGVQKKRKRGEQKQGGEK